MYGICTFSCFDFVTLCTCTCKCESLTSQQWERWFEQQLNGLTDLFHTVQENFMWLAMVARHHKNKGTRALLLITTHLHAACLNHTHQYFKPENHMHVTKLSQLLATNQNHSIRCTVYLKPYFGYYYIYQGNVEHCGASVSKLYIEALNRFTSG